MFELQQNFPQFFCSGSEPSSQLFCTISVPISNAPKAL